jgi:hypothetical protein
MNTRVGYGLALGLITALACALLAGCGGGDDGEESGEGGLAKAELVKRGDQICKDTLKQQAKIFRTSEFQQGNRKSEEAVVLAVAEPLNGEVERLGELEAKDKQDGEELDEVVTALDEALETVEENPSLMTGGKSGPFVQFDELAQGFGFKVCGRI